MLDAQRLGGGPALLFIEVSRRSSAAVGSDVGVQVLERIGSLIGISDVVYASGSEEYLVLLPCPGDVGAVSILAHRIAVACSKPVLVDGESMRISANVGVAMYPGDGESVDDLMRSADAALYRSRAVGSGHVRFYGSSTNSSVDDRVELREQIVGALLREEFVLAFQPIVDSFGDVHAVETLVRWHHPEFGVVGPDRFIPLCDETGLVVPLGHWVFSEAIRHVKLWDAAGLSVPRIAINVSSRELLEPGYAHGICETIESMGIASSRIEIEITESVLMTDVVGSRRVIDDLRSCGIRVALDDFGTGQSSLAYLRQFSVDAIKIDKSFVDEVVTESRGAAIVSALVVLSHAMGMTVVAEGIESAEQAEKIISLGCDEMQGYHFSKPLDAIALVEMLRLREVSSAPLCL